MRLGREFYSRNAVVVAKELLGKVLLYGDLSGIITETEAYRSEGDAACHAARGETKRNRPMFGPGGFSYVYFVYGMYYCLNVTAEEEGEAAAVLIRGVKPLDGIETMVANRGGKTSHLADGPGKLCRAFGITTCDNERDLVVDRGFSIEERGYVPEEILATPRIGISAAQELPWRFVAHKFHRTES